MLLWFPDWFKLCQEALYSVSIGTAPWKSNSVNDKDDMDGVTLTLLAKVTPSSRSQQRYTVGVCFSPIAGFTLFLLSLSIT